MNIKNLLFISAIITIIILITYFIVSRIYQNNNNNNNNNKNNNVKEGFILVADDNLYMPLKNIPPTDIKYQIPINQNQLTDTHLQSIDTDILRNIRVNKVFSQIDELDFYQFYNLLKYFRNLEIEFNYTQKDTSGKTVLKPNEKIIELNSGAINNTDLYLFYRIKLELISAINYTIIKSGYYN